MSSVEWTSEARQAYRKLGWQTVVGLSCVGLMAIATYVLLNSMIGGQGGDAETINVSKIIGCGKCLVFFCDTTD